MKCIYDIAGIKELFESVIEEKNNSLLLVECCIALLEACMWFDLFVCMQCTSICHFPRWVFLDSCLGDVFGKREQPIESNYKTYCIQGLKDSKLSSKTLESRE